MIEIEYSPQFAKMYKRLPARAQKAAEKKEICFRKNPHDPRLRTHKLHGRMEGLWSFSIDYQHRIIFSFETKNHVRFHAVGTHGMYL